MQNFKEDFLLRDVLLLDSDDIDAKVISRALKANVSNIDHCKSLASGLEHIRKDNAKYELIISDLTLTDSSGINTFVKLNEVAQKVPVLIVSNQDELTRCQDDLLANGAQECISKSNLSPNNLKRLVNSAIDRQKKPTEEIELKENLEEELEFKTKFLANFSHEIRTPLNAITGNISVLEDFDLDNGSKEIVENIKVGCEHLLRSVNEILDLSKMRANKLSLNFETTETSNLIYETFCLFNGQAESKNLKLITHVSPDVPRFFETDTHRIKQILSNFVSNAIKYTKKGWVKIHVDYIDKSKQLEIRVSDTGRGIKQKALPKLFDAFSQSEAEDTYIGTGLGLSISKLLAELFKGKVGAENNQEQGATFWLRIPIEGSKEKIKVESIDSKIVVLSKDTQRNSQVYSQLVAYSSNVEFLELNKRAGGISRFTDPTLYIFDDRDWEAKESHAIYSIMGFNEKSKIFTHHLDRFPEEYRMCFRSISGCQTEFFSELRDFELNKMRPLVNTEEAEDLIRQDWPKNVLICDDNELNRTILQKLLESLAINSLQAEDGLEAITMVKNHPEIDAIFMDCNMPEMDGFEASRKIIKSNPSMPIVAFTGLTYGEDIQKCLEAGMRYHIAKPLKKSILKDLLNQIAIQMKNSNGSMNKVG